MQLHAALIWGGEPIADVVLADPGRSRSARSPRRRSPCRTSGCPRCSRLSRPASAATCSPWATRWAAPCRSAARATHVADLVGDAPFAATPSPAGDWAGRSRRRRFAPAVLSARAGARELEQQRQFDLDTVLPAAAFSVLLHLFLLSRRSSSTPRQVSFAWPGARGLTGQSSRPASAADTPAADHGPPMMVVPPSGQPPRDPIGPTRRERQTGPAPRTASTVRADQARRRGRARARPLETGREVGPTDRDVAQAIENSLGDDIDWRKWVSGRGKGLGRVATVPATALGTAARATPTAEDRAAGGHKAHRRPRRRLQEGGAHRGARPAARACGVARARAAGVVRRRLAR